MRLTFTGCLLLLVFTATAQNQQTTKDLGKELSARYANDNNSNLGSYQFAETDPIGYDLLAANFSFSDKNQVQKVSFSPVRLSTKYIYLLSNTRLNFSHASGIVTAGLSIGHDNSSFEAPRSQAIFNNVYRNPTLPVARARMAGESLAQYVQYYNATPEMKTLQDNLLTQFDQRRLRHVVKYSAGYNIQLFSILKSKSQDSNFDSLNYHTVKADNLFAKGSYSFNNGCINVNFGYNYFNKRKAADSTQPKRKYDGYTVGVSIRAIPLIKKENLIKKDFYKNSLFIPAIYAGGIYDRANYKGDEPEFAEEKLKWKQTFTFFLDFAISPLSQFRIAVPVQRSREFLIQDKNMQVLGVLQYSLKFVNLTEN